MMVDTRHAVMQAEGESCDSSSVTLPVVVRYVRPRRFATSADKQAAYRRRRARVPESLPRIPNRHGRRSLPDLYVDFLEGHGLR
jgi:hypothetical protein